MLTDISERIQPSPLDIGDLAGLREGRARRQLAERVARRHTSLRMIRADLLGLLRIACEVVQLFVRRRSDVLVSIAGHGSELAPAEMVAAVQSLRIDRLTA